MTFPVPMRLACGVVIPAGVSPRKWIRNHIRRAEQLIRGRFGDVERERRRLDRLRAALAELDAQRPTPPEAA